MQVNIILQIFQQHLSYNYCLNLHKCAKSFRKRDFLHCCCYSFCGLHYIQVLYSSKAYLSISWQNQCHRKQDQKILIYNDKKEIIRISVWHPHHVYQISEKNLEFFTYFTCIFFLNAIFFKCLNWLIGLKYVLSMKYIDTVMPLPTLMVSQICC